MNPRVFLNVVSMQARQRLSYRADFWIEAVAGFIVTVTVAWFRWRAIFEGSGEETIGGFTLRGMIA